MFGIANKLARFNPWHFLWIGILSAELFTVLSSYIFCTLWYGYVPEEIFLVGMVDAFFVSVIVCWLIIFFLNRIQQSNILNARLSQEIENRKITEQVFRQSREELELRIVERTAELARANLELQAEINERKKVTEMAVLLEERGRLARELHDSVSQSLYSMTLFAETSRQLAESGDLQGLRNTLAELIRSAQGVLKEFRLLLYDLRPSTLEEDGLADALRQRLEAVEQRSGVKGGLLVDQVDDMSSLIEEGLYRIAQEALNNSLKHSCATEVQVRLRTVAGRTEMEVVDNGVGFAVDTVGGGGGMGLLNMQERARKMGGDLTILTSPGSGTVIKAAIAAE